MKIVRDFGLILSSEVVLTAASIISFPIFARLFSKADYGAMSLVTLSVMLVVRITSGGFCNAILRLFGQHADVASRGFVNTIRAATLAFTLAGMALYLCFAGLGNSQQSPQQNYFLTTAVASFILLIRSMTSIELSLLRISDKVVLMNAFNILIRYGGIAISVFLVFRYRSLLAFLVGTLTAEGLAYAAICSVIHRKFPPLRFSATFDTKLFCEVFSYGFPLALTGLLTYVLATTDRYVIGYFLSTERVAEYTVAVNYCNYPMELLRNVYLGTFIPLIMNSWSGQDDGRSSRLLQDFIASYFWLALPVIAGLTLTDSCGIRLLAGAKYSAIPYLVPLLAAAFALNGMNFVYVRGLLYGKKSLDLLYLNCLTCLVNLALNLLLVPLVGIYGSAAATMISQIAFMVIACNISRRVLPLRWPSEDMVMALAATAGMAISVIEVSRLLDTGDDQFVLKVVVGCLSYAGFASLCGRSKIKRVLAELRPRISVGGER